MRTSYTDEAGRKWIVELPNGAPESDAHMGLRVGPPSLSELNLPEDIEIRLHNALVDRGILTFEDAKTRILDIHTALRIALGVESEKIQALYYTTVSGKPVPTTGASSAVGKRRK